MKIGDLINRLTSLKTKHGNLEVLLSQMGDDPYSIEVVRFTEIETDDRYPNTYGIPKKFIELSNF
jgi:hypothetical protein